MYLLHLLMGGGGGGGGGSKSISMTSESSL